MTARYSALEQFPGYWLGRAAVRIDTARQMARISGDTSAEVLREYQIAARYEAEATRRQG